MDESKTLTINSLHVEGKLTISSEDLETVDASIYAGEGVYLGKVYTKPTFTRLVMTPFCSSGASKDPKFVNLVIL